MMREDRFISQKLLSEGISLVSIGINEIAWTAENIYIVLDEIKQCNATILGGDVYKIENDKIHPTVDSWFFSDEDIESRVDLTKKYIEKYENNTGTYIYSIVLQ